MEFDFAEADVKQSEGNQEEVKIGDVEDASIDEGISMDLKGGDCSLAWFFHEISDHSSDNI